LKFGWNFNQPVDNLPQNLKHLTFGAYFNNPVDNLPQSIRHITVGRKFNKSLTLLKTRPNITCIRN
jgi:hypothetical protein